MPKANFPSEHPDQLPDEDDSGFDLMGGDLAPPPFLFPNTPETPESDASLRDAFITDTAKRELETTQDLFRFLPTADLNALDSIGHPVRDAFLDPFRNCNLHRSNLQLLVELWEKQGPERNLEQLSQVLAIAWQGSAQTFRSLPEEISQTNWESGDAPIYAESRYWARGFSALTWEENYFKMGEELGLDLVQHPQLALLPEVAGAILGTGLFVGGFANTGTMARYFRGERETGPNKLGQALQETAQKLHSFLKTDLGSKPSQPGWTSLLLASLEEESRQRIWFSETAFLLAVLGYSTAATAPEEAEPKVLHAYECNRVQGLFEGPQIGNWPELARFQTDFNRAHPLRKPLNEQGLLDEATFEAISAGGFRLRAGKQMVQFTFGGTLQASSPLNEAFELHARQEINAEQWARKVYQCMPVESPLQFNKQLEQLPARAARQLTMALLAYAPEPDQMALFNRPILEKMKSILSESSLLSEVEQAISGAFGKESQQVRPGEQLDGFLALEAQPPMRYAIAGKSGGWNSLLLQFKDEGVTKDELLALNPQVDPSLLNPGELMVLPLRVRRAFWKPTN